MSGGTQRLLLANVVLDEDDLAALVFGVGGRAMSSPELAAWLAEQGLELLDYRQL